MIYSKRIVIALLSAASCFQLVMGGTQYVDEGRGRYQIGSIRTVTTIDGCESNKYGIWLFAGSGHVSLIGEPIVVVKKKKDAATSNNSDHEDPKNGISTSSADKSTSCPTLVFEDGGEKLEKAMIDMSIVILEQEDSSNSSPQDPASTSHESHAALWKEDAMRLHKTNHHNANKTTSSSFVLSEVTGAYHHAMRRMGDYDIFNNNCATFVLNMMAQLGIKVDDRMIKFAASELYKNHTVVAPVLQNQTFMEDLFLEFSDDGASTPGSHTKATTTGLLRSNKRHHQAQPAAGGLAADSLEGTEMFVAHYVKEWSAKHYQMRKKTETPP